MSIFNNLVKFDQQASQETTETIQPELASEWSWSEDGTKLTFKLREGVKWHDGKPFTAADVKCTFDMLMETSETQKLRSEEHTSELQSLRRRSYAVFCVNK